MRASGPCTTWALDRDTSRKIMMQVTRSSKVSSKVGHGVTWALDRDTIRKIMMHITRCSKVGSKVGRK